MTAAVFSAVLIAAALHAGWNAIVKSGTHDRYLAISLVSIACGAVALPMLPFARFPNAASWPWLTASALLHAGYNVFLAKAYRSGDLGQVYPIARGAAPLLVTATMLAVFSERLAWPELAGVLALVCGVVLMSLRGGRALERPQMEAVAAALATSFFIAAYTVSDGAGARANGSAHGYALWLFFLDGAFMLVLLLVRRSLAGVRELRPFWQRGVAGGAMSVAAYWIIIWAMTVAPVALVSALRESSVLFAAAISTVVLREPVTRWRVAAALTIMVGIVLLKLG